MLRFSRTASRFSCTLSKNSRFFSTVGGVTSPTLSFDQLKTVEAIGNEPRLMSNSAQGLTAQQCRDYALVLLREAELKEKSTDRRGANNAFDYIDGNKDGVVSRTEFTKWYHNHYEHLLKADKSLSDSEAEECGHIPARDVALVCIKSMIPYVGFGMCDNALMIIFGDIIDQTIGVRFCLTTMAAAGLGNLISCSTGVFTGGLIDRWVLSLGLPTPNLTPAQMQSSKVRNIEMAGSVLGIMTGCLLGMFPLLFLEEGFFKKPGLDQETKTEAATVAAA